MKPNVALLFCLVILMCAAMMSVAQGPQVNATTQVRNLPTLGDNWLSYVPIVAPPGAPGQLPNGVANIWTIPIAARKVSVFNNGLRLSTAAEVMGTIQPDYSWVAAGTTTTITFTPAGIPASGDNVVVVATQ